MRSIIGDKNITRYIYFFFRTINIPVTAILQKKRKKGKNEDEFCQMIRFFPLYSLSWKNLIKRTSRLTSTKCNIFPIKMIFREIYSNVFPVINSLALVVFSILFNVQSRTRAPLFAQYFDFTNVYRARSILCRLRDIMNY